MTILDDRIRETVSNPYLESETVQSDPILKEQIVKTEYDIGGETFEQNEVGTQDTDVMQFVDEEQNISVGNAGRQVDTTYSFGDDTLAEFFSRPIRLTTDKWDVGTYFSKAIAPQNYFRNPAVLNKLQNYELISFDLHMKIVINATPFHYGMLYAGALPDPRVTIAHKLTGFPTIPTKCMKLTNRIYTKTQVSDSTPLLLDMPYINKNNYSRITDVISHDDYMWEVELQSPTILEAVSDTASTSVTISTFVWATNVQLTVPTSTTVVYPDPFESRKTFSKDRKAMAKNAGKFAKSAVGEKNMAKARQQSKKGVGFIDKMRTMAGDTISPEEIQQREANEDGVISNVASSASKLLGMASSVPIIGGYASMAAGAVSTVGKVASFFGFSRVPIESEQMYIKQMPFSSLALTSGPETVRKLTIDPKQGTTIDPSIIGTSALDEMAFSSIHQRESLLSTVLWTEENQVDHELFWANVTPLYSRTEGTTHTLSNVGAVALPFKYWSGSMKYRVEVVASKFHNGRIRISYEPHGADLSSDYNTAYSQVVDISECRDIEFTVPWAQPEAYKQVNIQLANEFLVPPSGIKNYSDLYHNGILYISVLNELTSPDASKPIYINVYASAGADIEFKQPTETLLRRYGFRETIPAPSPFESGIMRAPIHKDLFGHITGDDQLAEKQNSFFGETYTSFRAMIKRYGRIETMLLDQFDPLTDNLVVLEGALSDFPLGCGYVGKTRSRTAANDRYNYHSMTLLEFVSNLYCFRRGAYRYKLDFQLAEKNQRNPFISMYVGRGLSTQSLHTQETFDLHHSHYTQGGQLTQGGFNYTMNNLYDNTIGTFWRGADVTRADVNTALEYEIPFYSIYRYLPATTRGQELLDFKDHAHTIFCEMSSKESTSAEVDVRFSYLTRSVGTGEDFSLYHYMGSPLLFNRTSPLPYS